MQLILYLIGKFGIGVVTVIVLFSREHDAIDVIEFVGLVNVL